MTDIKAIFQLSPSKDRTFSESDLIVTNSTFVDLITDDTCRFLVVERDDMRGFNVFIDNVCVVPGHYLCIEAAPLWLQWLIGRVCRRVIWPRAAIAKATGDQDD